jgi:hypothetical protein
MKHFLVQRKKSNSDRYDYSTFIVSANSAEQAIRIARSGYSESITLDDFVAVLLKPTKTARENFQFQSRKISQKSNG